MFYIDVNRENIIKARDKHYRMMRYIIKKKLNGTRFSEEPPVSNMNRIRKTSNIENSILNFLNDDSNLKKVLIGTPGELDTIKNKFRDSGNELKKIINYDMWIKTNETSTYKYYNAYSLAQNLDIPTCPYCGRMYTKTVEKKNGKKITRPTFDHWFPKSIYPLLALSFYNLIPSCTVCNSGLKGAKTYSLNDLFHPYNKRKEFNYKFSYSLNSYDECSFKILTSDDFSKKSIETFELEEIYKAHEDEIKDLLKIRQAYSETYIEMLESQILTNIHLDRNEVYRLAFGVHYEEANFDRRPLSKMKKDILTELGIIKEK